jgi:hypothetical protein
MTGLSGQEIQGLLNSNKGPFYEQQAVYKMIFDHIEDTSIGRMAFKNWLEITSVFDENTLLYGIYDQTFPNPNSLQFSCPACKKSIDFMINASILIKVEDQEVYGNIQNILQTITTPKEALAKSYMNRTKRIQLKESKIIVNLKVPSLADKLENIRLSSDPNFNEIQNIVGMNLFVKDLLMPNIAVFEQTGEKVYISIKDQLQRILTLKKLSFDDMKNFIDGVEEFGKKYLIEYKIPSIECPHCGNEEKDTPIDFAELLFTVARQRMIKSN